MTNHSNTDDDATDFPVGAVDLADPELEQLLGDAYQAPAVPRSLLRRLDGAIEKEWGESPRLADSASAKVGRTFVRGARWVRTLPIAAALGLLIVLAVLFRPTAPAYAWSQLVEAFSGQELVELESDNVKRWMALSQGLVSREGQNSSELLDVRQQVALQRARGVDEIRQEAVTIRNPTNEQIILTFLSGAPHQRSDRFQSIRVIDEHCGSLPFKGKSHIVLGVTFECQDLSIVSLQAYVDPDTHLPVKLKMAGDDMESQNVLLSYPRISVAERKSVAFPSDMPIVDSTEIRTASNDGVDAGHLPEVADNVPVPEEEVVADVPEQPEVHVDRQEAPFVGAASNWRPVQVVKRGRDQVIAQLDGTLETLWKENNVMPAPVADAEEMLRRVYLDLAGRTPGVTEVRDYLQDKSPDRYTNLVNRLLASPDHATHLAAMYRTFLIPEGIDLTPFGGIEAFDQWLSERFASNDSYDEVVRNLLLAEGRLSRSGPLLFYSATKLDPDQLAARTSRVFLGMRLECAQCHDHPFEPWTQKDFWSYAAFFARISRPQGELENVSTVMRVRDVDRGEVMIPDTEEVVAPKFLNSSLPLGDAQANGRRRELAKWLTSGSNPYFPRATANRVWGQMFGRGLVDPIDDFGVENPPVSAEALDLLASHFIDSRFDLRELFRTIALSRAYQLSSGAADVDETRVDLFAQMNVKTLTAEQVYDCITVATMPSGSATTGFNVDRFNNSSREEFLSQFRTPTGRPVEYQGGIPQALTLMNGSLIDGATGLSESGLLQSLEAPFFSNKQRVEILYFATLSRRPTAVEEELLNEYIDDNTSGTVLKESLADVLWALLNSAEFTMNH